MCIMKHIGRYAILVVIAICCALSSRAQHIVVSAPSHVSAGENFRLAYTINTRDVEEFRMGGVPEAYVPYYVKYDPNLKPQNTVNWEFGADLNFFDNRVRLEYTASYQDIKDQIFDVPTAGSTGYQYLRTNAGEMTTWSHEFSINASIIQTKDWDLDLGVNFTKLTNKVKSLADGVESIMLGGFVEPQVRAQAGYTYPNIYGVAFQRDEQGRLLLQDGLPVGTAGSQNLGECTPDFNMGFNLKARWKRLSLSATMDWQKGGKMYNGTLLTLNYFGATKESIPYHEGTMVAEGIDIATGQPNTVEVSKQEYWMAYNNITEAGIYDRSFLKLRDVTLSYQLPKFAGIDISVYGFARNVLLWSKMKGRTSRTLSSTRRGGPQRIAALC